jgi:hypothetical protein
MREATRPQQAIDQGSVGRHGENIVGDGKTVNDQCHK